MIDETSRKLIERAAAHLRARGQAPAAPMAPPPTPPVNDPYVPPPAGRAAYAPQSAMAPESAYREPVLAGPASPRHRGAGPRAQAAPAYLEEEYEEPPPAPQGHSRQVSIDRNSLARHGIAIPSAKRSRVVEEFRMVKRQVVGNYMEEAADDAMNKNRVIMVTSARPREGKTFTAINLALSIATEQDLKVLLIDLDTKYHAMQDMMGIPANYGLIDLLSNPEIDFSDVVLRTNLPNLTVMPAGTPNVRSPELLSSKRTRAMFTEMTQRYSDRFIIFDAPSVLGSSDPAVLAGLVGQVVMVVEADRTQQEEVETAVGLISACPIVSLLLNKIRTSAADQFGSYSDY
ncbi:MAG: AAA family ATPase [Stellaceae bacterium]